MYFLEFGQFKLLLDRDFFIKELNIKEDYRLKFV